jgi:hypothetical protein
VFDYRPPTPDAEDRDTYQRAPEGRAGAPTANQNARVCRLERAATAQHGMDLVAHCGPVNRGSYVNSLVLTGIASGWTEAAPIVVREGWLSTLERIREGLPFALRSLDVDNGTEFVNNRKLSISFFISDSTQSEILWISSRLILSFATLVRVRPICRHWA